jgi:hypothetical protein
MARNTHSIEVLAPVPLAAERARDTGPAGVDPRDLPPLQPRGVGETLDTAFDVLRARFVTLMLLTVPLWIPVKAFSRFAFRLDQGTQVLLLFPNFVALAVVQGLAVGLVVVVVYGFMQGRSVRARTAAAIGLRRAPALLLLTAISGVVIGMAMCCFPVGIALSWLWMVAPAALILERLGPIEALGRSVRLVQGSFLRWAGIMIIQWIPSLFISAYVGVLDNPELRGGVREALTMPPLLFDVLDVLVVSLLHSLATVLGAVVLTVYYLDNRVRSEGFDLHMRFERLRARHPVRAAKETS